MSCKHMKANQLVSEVYYQGFNTDLEGALSVAQSLVQISTCIDQCCSVLSCSYNKKVCGSPLKTEAKKKRRLSIAV